MKTIFFMIIALLPIMYVSAKADFICNFVEIDCNPKKDYLSIDIIEGGNMICQKYWDKKKENPNVWTGVTLQDKGMRYSNDYKACVLSDGQYDIGVVFLNADPFNYFYRLKITKGKRLIYPDQTADKSFDDCVSNILIRPGKNTEIKCDYTSYD